MRPPSDVDPERVAQLRSSPVPEQPAERSEQRGEVFIMIRGRSAEAEASSIASRVSRPCRLRFERKIDIMMAFFWRADPSKTPMRDIVNWVSEQPQRPAQLRRWPRTASRGMVKGMDQLSSRTPSTI